MLDGPDRDAAHSSPSTNDKKYVSTSRYRYFMTGHNDVQKD